MRHAFVSLAALAMGDDAAGAAWDGAGAERQRGEIEQAWEGDLLDLDGLSEDEVRCPPARAQIRTRAQTRRQKGTDTLHIIVPLHPPDPCMAMPRRRR